MMLSWISFDPPAIIVVAPLAAIGCVYLFFSLSMETKLLFVAWAAIGLVVYFLYGYRRSHVGLGVTEVPELDPDAPPGPVAPMPGAPAPGDRQH